MSTYFTIGEVSKLFNLPIKTLRYYDEKGILKPSYVNSKNNYRYYSREQFINIDVIKYCKLIGMSLEEIKGLLNSDGSIESMLNTMKRQSNQLEKKIEELSKLKSYLDGVEKSIEDVLEYELDKVFIKYNKERKIAKYDCELNSMDEFEIALRNIILHLENKYNDVYPLLGASMSYESFNSENRMVYKDIRDFSEREEDEKTYILPEGEYITIIFDDDWSNSENYYRKMMDYIKKNDIEVVGDFNEIWVMPRVDSNGKEKYLVQLEILKKK